MATIYLLVSFRGQPNPTRLGQRDNEAFANMAHFLKDGKGEVSRFCYFAEWGWQKSLALAMRVLTVDMMPFFASYYGAQRNFSECRFILWGTSAGAVSALALANLVPDAQIAYIGLADGAFYDNDSSFLMKNPQSKGYFANENYYQTADQKPGYAEIHGSVAGGFTNKDLTSSLSWAARNTGAGAHAQAVNNSVGPASVTIKRCIDSDRSS